MGPRSSIAVIPTSTVTGIVVPPTHRHSQRPSIQLSRSVDRLNNKSQRREIRYEEHDDFVPSPLYSIQCHPTVDHYAKNLDQSVQLSATRRRSSQIEVNQPRSSITSTEARFRLPRPYSSNIPLSLSLAAQNLQQMARATSENQSINDTYGKLSECHSPLTPLENSVVKAPRRIESAYGQFPTSIPISQEPVYANTQSLYDNILYPQSSARASNRTDYFQSSRQQQQQKSCASQTQLTWTMATFSSFVDLENQSVVIPQPDPTTLYSIVQHYQPRITPSASPETIEHLKRLTPEVSSLAKVRLSSNQNAFSSL